MLTVRREDSCNCPIHVQRLSIGWSLIGEHHGSLRVYFFLRRFLFYDLSFWFQSKQSETFLLFYTFIINWALFFLSDVIGRDLRWLGGWRSSLKAGLLLFLRQLLNDVQQSTLILLCFSEIRLQSGNPFWEHFKGVSLILTSSHWTLLFALVEYDRSTFTIAFWQSVNSLSTILFLFLFDMESKGLA